VAGAHVKLTAAVGVDQRARVHAAGMAQALPCTAPGRGGAFGTGSLRETRHPPDSKNINEIRPEMMVEAAGVELDRPF
jgi:hypothetical protein